MINLFDLDIFASQWLDMGNCSADSDCADLNGDNTVDFLDYAVMGQNYR